MGISGPSTQERHTGQLQPVKQPAVRPVTVRSPIISAVMAVVAAVVSGVSPVSGIKGPGRGNIAGPVRTTLPASRGFIYPGVVTVVIPPVDPDEARALLGGPLPRQWVTVVVAGMVGTEGGFVNSTGS